MQLKRRQWIIGLGACLISRSLFATIQANPSDVDAIKAQAKKAGLPPLREKATNQYLVLGDAPEAFTSKAAEICEGLATDFFKHFKSREFTVDRPKEKLIVVALAGPKSFASFLELELDQAVGGIYDLPTNRLLIFDNRARDDAGPNAQRANTVALTHEATHQLCFNSGLLRRDGDVPLAISEGLAMYAEVRRPDGKTSKIGDVNLERLKVLRDARTDGESWLPVKQLIANDALFEDPKTEQLAYALSWLLVHMLMKPTKVQSFRDYLKTLKLRTTAADRLTDAERHLGDFDRLDKDLLKHANTISRR